MGGYTPGQASTTARSAESDVMSLKVGKIMGIIMCESSYTMHKVLSPRYTFLGICPVGCAGAHF